MPNPTDLATHIQNLLTEKETLASRVAAIDSTLAKVALALGGNHHARVATKKLGRPKGKRTRQKFAVSGDDSILTFVKLHKNPMGREIEKRWKEEGRKGTAANALTKLTKDKKLKRTPLKDERGSRYSLA